jgi:serine-type D-Ala-D-Ala carboxypeptidase (penicillin-binding protein 5/6)
MFPAALLLLLALTVVPARGAENPFPDVARAYLVKAGAQVLWARDSDQPLPPASLTKVMTALLVLDDYRPGDVVTISGTAAAQTGTRLGLKAGERMRVDNLLQAMLVTSANDACLALAEWRAGTQRRFVAQMNQRAKALGLRRTHFANACGFDGADHLSTVEDLAQLAESALRSDTFAAIVAQARATVRTADGRRTFDIASTNALLGRLPGAIGVKSGYTRRAGRCLIALAERNGVRVLLVMLDGRDRWWDAHGLIERAFTVHAHGT